MPDFGEDVFESGWIAEVGRALKDSGALYLFTRWDVLQLWREAIEGAGLKVVQRLVWDKTHWSMGDLRYWGSQTEDILFCTKGVHQMRWEKRRGNVISGNTYCLREGQFDHPTQKPEPVIETLIEVSSMPDETVLDLHCGSGTTAVAARRLGRRWLCGDIRADYVEMSRQRVRETQPPLFVLEPEQEALPL